MRRAGLIACVALLVMTVGVSLGCGGGGGSSGMTPTEVADAYMRATVNLDVDAAWELMSKADQESISKEEMAQSVTAEMQALELDYTLGAETIEGDTATVEVTLTVTDKASGQSQEVTDTLDLVKEDGEWKVSFGGSM
jgi:uncharacterized membrane protein